MTGGRGAAIAAALWAAAIAGCGFGAGPSSKGTATLTVTRDYGATSMVAASDTDPSESETVLRLLDREASITTRYGGGFVQSIDGLSGAERGGRRHDWFFYVNGIESPVGSADVSVHPGDEIWWDYRDWTDAMRVPAVVGSWPQPFGAAAAGPVAVACVGATGPCRTAADRLRAEGVSARLRGFAKAKPAPAARIVVGPWARLRADPAVAQLEGGPATSGVFARFERAPRHGWTLVALDVRARTARVLGPGAGLVAAVRDGDAPPTWIVTAERERGVRRAAESLDEHDLRDRYAVAVAGGRAVPLPIVTSTPSAG
ncbi:MAG TPA: DUF4430 domain-containing protein [Solirubrobacterales bacterium]|nr:DUF4430 domain-containing protein [Solirubrobacterales bacterium]